MDFIEKNMLYKPEDIDIYLIQSPEKPNKINPITNLSNKVQKRTKMEIRPNKLIKKKSFLDHIFCCKNKNRKDMIYSYESDAASDFYKSLVDAKRILIILSQFEDLKKYV